MGDFHESSCKEKTQDLRILLPLRVRSMITPVKFIRLTSQLLWGSWFEEVCQYCKYCKCSHNSFQSEVPWSQLQLLWTKFATDAWFWECAFPSRFCWFTYMGKVHVMSTDPLSSCKELTNKKMQSIDTCWWLDVFLTMLCAKNVPDTDASKLYEMKVMWYASISSETPPSGQCSCSQCTDLFAGKATVAW